MVVASLLSTDKTRRLSNLHFDQFADFSNERDTREGKERE